MDIYGFDVGTGNLVSSKYIGKDKVELKSMRNMFLSIDPELLTTTEVANTELDYAESKDEDGNVDQIYILGEDAFRFGNIFNKEVSRPMAKGVISSSEIDAMDVLSLMCNKLTGKTKNGYCVYSVPAAAIDVDIPPVLYHERVFGKIFKTLGYESKALNEGMAVIYSNCAKEQFSGIGISFGAGLTNIACSYKGTTTMTFSVSRGGDWIDKSVAKSLGIIPNRVTSIKEKDLDLMNYATGKKKERRVKESLTFYYEDLIKYVLNVIAKRFDEDSDGLDIDTKIPIIVSGGTSIPNGFVDLFKEVFNNIKDFPYDISEIRRADDPLNAVGIGCMQYAYWEKKKSGEIKETNIEPTKKPGRPKKEKNDERNT